jgi:dihydroxyacetone kinase-like protein
VSVEVDNFVSWLRDTASTLHDNAAYLTELDSAIGDADHGANMDRGFQAIVAVLDETSFASVDELMKKAGMTLVSKVGGASGPLYGTFFLRFGTALAGVELTPATIGEAFRAGVGAGGSDLSGALTAAAEAAAKGRDATVPLVARKGRASYLGERSAGHQDPGATSTTLLLESAARILA